MAVSRIMKYNESSHSSSDWLYCKKPLLHFGLPSLYVYSITKILQRSRMQDPKEGPSFYSPLFSFFFVRNSTRFSFRV